MLCISLFLISGWDSSLVVGLGFSCGKHEGHCHSQYPKAACKGWMYLSFIAPVVGDASDSDSPESSGMERSRGPSRKPSRMISIYASFSRPATWSDFNSSKCFQNNHLLCPSLFQRMVINSRDLWKHLRLFIFAIWLCIVNICAMD